MSYAFIIQIFIVLYGSFLYASEIPWSEFQTAVEKKDFLQTQSRIAQLKEKNKSGENLLNLNYFLLWTAHLSGQHEKVIELADELLPQLPLLEEEILSFRSEAYLLTGQHKKAESDLTKLLSLNPNQQLKQEAELRQARLMYREGKSVTALRMFRQLEKKSRNTPGYPEVVTELARAELKLGTRAQFCVWMNRLYQRHPLFGLVDNWGSDLASNHFDGVPTGCSQTVDHFKERVRSLLWHGEDEKSKQEVIEVAKRIEKENKNEAQELRAWFLVQSGYPDEAYQILKELIAQRKDQVPFLRVLAIAAARAGDGAASIAAHHRIWELQPNSESGRRALYQAAVMSYQFQDYDGADRRFRQFISKYPKSGLAKDAQWNLAWITYLKGNFVDSENQFQNLLSRKVNAERSKYWLAMSQLRNQKTQAARKGFLELLQTKDTSYYAVAARQRLERLPKEEIRAPVPFVMGPRLLGPPQISEQLWPSEFYPSKGFESSSSVETESEDILIAEIERGDGVVAEGEESLSDPVSETGRSEIIVETPASSRINSRRFARAELLTLMGFFDRSRWELYEIERRTTSREDLRRLMSAYEQAQQWQRSSYIAQVHFSNQRKRGIEEERLLWQKAYPQAFASDVKLAARKNGIHPEFVWAIMRTESRYRREAVSPVGALGLMQIMPGTGRRLASLQNDRAFQKQQLFNPRTSIQYGSFYLRRLLNEFNQQMPLSAAAYNAGPHRVHSWLLSFGHLDMDEFIEHIPFLETRDYVRKVVAATSSYSLVHGDQFVSIELSRPPSSLGIVERSKKEIWDN